jgi:2-polyprenyl-6-hydroxyphenyl methylase/3-demethylubiquinone-9 3-methyltransferase
VSFDNEIKSGDRFKFGENWSKFLDTLNDDRINAAERELSKWLGGGRLDGKTFLDIGSGSGIHSLAAKRLGAKVFSFDYDTSSVECTKELKRRYFENDENWSIEQGSVLDREYLSKLGEFDIVYSWGVLHHTGNLWGAMDNIHSLVKKDGVMFLAIYNHQMYWSKFWIATKKFYNKAPKSIKGLMIGLYFARCWFPPMLKDLFTKGNPLYRWNYRTEERGMNPWVDVIDWIGGYPFEVAKPEEVFDFYHKKGFELTKLLTSWNGHGNNHFVFRKK